MLDHNSGRTETNGSELWVNCFDWNGCYNIGTILYLNLNSIDFAFKR